MNVVILCPSNVRTGGPEALHQLSDSLIRYGIDTHIWYTVDEDQMMLADFKGDKSQPLTIELTTRVQEHGDYTKYEVKSNSKLVIDEQTVFIVPETYLHWLNLLPKRLSIIWWLSFDNGLRSLAASGINFNLFRTSNFIHAHQSEYVQRILTDLDFPHLFKLTDYTPPPTMPPRAKTKIALNSGGKVIFDTELLADNLKNITNKEIKLVRDLSRDEVYQLFAESYCYIDLGNFPGKDRMAREAALLNCIPLVLDVAGAKDYELPSTFKIGIDQVNSLPMLVRSIVENHARHLQAIECFKTSILLEELEFHKQVLTLIHHLHLRGMFS